MKIRLARFLLVTILVVTSFGPAAASNPELAQPAAAQSVTGSPAQATRGQVVSASDAALQIQFSAPSYQAKTELRNNQTHTIFDVPGAYQAAQPGKPVLPVFSVLVGIPADANYQLVTAPYAATPVKIRAGIAIAEQRAVQDPLNGDLLPGVQPAAPAGALAAQDILTAAPVRIVDEAWLRDQRILRLEYSPLQYNPADGIVSWVPDVQVQLRFNPNSQAALHPVSQAEVLQRSQDSFEKVLQASLLNYNQATAWRAIPKPDLPDNFGFTQAASLSSSVQLVVDHDGIYKVTYEALTAAGMNVSGDPANFQLSSQGRPVAYFLQGNGDNTFGPGEALVFYGEMFKGDYLASVYATSMAQWSWICPTVCKLKKQLEDYTNENTYWLSMGTTPGLHAGSVDGTPHDTAVQPTSFPYTAHAEEAHIWNATHFADEEVWFWALTAATMTTTYSTNLSAISPDLPTAVITGSMIARAATPGHHATFFFNSYPKSITAGTWDYRSRYTFRTTIPITTTVNNGLNTLKMVMSNASANQVYFDWFEVSYAHLFQAQNDSLKFTYPLTGTFQYQVKGLASSSAVVLDITDPIQPVQVLNPRVTADGASGAFKAEFEAAQAAPAKYILSGSGALQTPKQVRLYNPPDLTPPGNGADYLLITNQKFITATNMLASYRQGQGLSTFIVNIDDVIKQFNYGIYNSVAIRNYLAFAMSSWQVKPRYVLLVGDGHFNFKSNSHPSIANIGRADTIYMPPNLAFIDPWQGQTDSTPLLAMVVGNDPLPDLYIGRLPVNSEAQAEIMVNKTIAYEQQAAHQGWQKNLTYIADNPDVAGDFNQSALDLASQYTPKGFTANKVFVSNYMSAPALLTRKAISQTVNITGTLFLTYIGHASVNYWADEGILTTKTVTATMKNPTMLPVLLSLDCLDGFWHYYLDPVNNSSLSETMVRLPSGGAVAAFSPTGLGLNDGHDTLAAGFFSSFFNGISWDLAPATLAGKLALYKTGSHFDLLYTYSILGDPALKVQGFVQKSIFMPILNR